MGQFEKIVVLLAFFLVTLILVVTFSGDPEQGLLLSMGDQEVAAAGETHSPALGVVPEAGPSVPVQGAASPEVHPSPVSRSLQESLQQEQQQQAELQARQPAPADLFLDDNFSTRPKVPAVVPAGSALVTLEGLQRTWDDSLMEYEWRRGDTWAILARRLYGDSDMSKLLRQFNEGNNYVPPGTTVLIPVYDRRENTSREAAGARKLGASGAKADSAEPSEERGTLYRVVDGDSLWVISKKVYGKGHLWERIYEANSGLLASPESVKPGMGLRIP